MLPLAYIASPYSDPDPNVRQQRYDAVCAATKAIAEQGIYAVYSPIAHWHPIALTFNLPKDAKFWKDQNYGVMNVADTIIVLKLHGWISSIGVDMEIQFARDNNKNLIYMEAL